MKQEDVIAQLFTHDNSWGLNTKTGTIIVMAGTLTADAGDLVSVYGEHKRINHIVPIGRAYGESFVEVAFD